MKTFLFSLSGYAPGMSITQNIPDRILLENRVAHAPAEGNELRFVTEEVTDGLRKTLSELLKVDESAVALLSLDAHPELPALFALAMDQAEIRFRIVQAIGHPGPDRIFERFGPGGYSVHSPNRTHINSWDW